MSHREQTVAESIGMQGFAGEQLYIVTVFCLHLYNVSVYNFLLVIEVIQMYTKLQLTLR